MNWIDEKVEDFDGQFVPTDWLVASAGEKSSNDSGINNGVAMYHTLRIKEWLRTALEEARTQGAEAERARVLEWVKEEKEKQFRKDVTNEYENGRYKALDDVAEFITNKTV